MPILNWFRRVRENKSSNQPYDTTFDDLRQNLSDTGDDKPAAGADDNGAPDVADANDSSDFDFDSD